MYKIREVKETDYDAINMLGHEDNVHLQKFRSPIDDTVFQKILTDKSNRVYIVEKHSQMLAFIAFQLDYETSTVHINKLTIDSAYVKKGLDEHLYSKVERLAERGGFAQMKAEITTSSRTVQDFFERNGWIKINNTGDYEKVFK